MFVIYTVAKSTGSSTIIKLEKQLDILLFYSTNGARLLKEKVGYGVWPQVLTLKLSWYNGGRGRTFCLKTYFRKQ